MDASWLGLGMAALCKNLYILWKFGLSEAIYQQETETKQVLLST